MTKMLCLSACLVAYLAVGACATTKPAVKKVQIRPILTSTKTVEPSKFNAKTALADAQNLQHRADYIASHDAYKALLMRLNENLENENLGENLNVTHKTRADALLGFADSGLSLVWLDEKYKKSARAAYFEISKSAHSSETDKRRAMSGTLLLGLTEHAPDVIESQLHIALRHSPDDPRLWNALGKLHDGNAEWLDALDAYVKALTVAKKMDANTAAIVNNMGMSLLMQGRKKEALAKFRQASASDPNMPVYDNNLRLAQTLSDEANAALKGLSAARAAQIYNDAGVIAQARGETQKAHSFYKKAVEKSPVYFKLAEKNLANLTETAKLSKPAKTPTT